MWPVFSHSVNLKFRLHITYDVNCLSHWSQLIKHSGLYTQQPNIPYMHTQKQTLDKQARYVATRWQFTFRAEGRRMNVNVHVGTCRQKKKKKSGS